MNTPTLPASTIEPTRPGLLGIGSPRVPEFCSNCGHHAATIPVTVITRRQVNVCDFTSDAEQAEWCAACVEGESEREVYER